jgi:hypothetical protein
MTRKNLIKKTIEQLNKLNESQLQEVFDFADFLLHKMESKLLEQGIIKLAKKSKSYQFLAEDEDLYTVKDIKVKYSAQNKGNRIKSPKKKK